MTTIDPTTIAAGPELDALVAERVMGWTYGQTGEDYSGWNGAPCNSDAWRGRWSPSTNIAHAWEVVAQLQFGFKGKRQLYLQTDGYGSELWRASWHRPEEYVTQAEVEADTAPLAICRAALKAVAQ